jgi:hypothetical protein
MIVFRLLSSCCGGHADDCESGTDGLGGRYAVGCCYLSRVWEETLYFSCGVRGGEERRRS